MTSRTTQHEKALDAFIAKKAQIDTILSALEGTPRNPANKAAALKAIEKSAKALGLSLGYVLKAADGLTDGRMTPAEFLAEL